MLKKGNVYDGALEYMEKRYGEEFSYIGPWGSTGTPRDQHPILVSAKSLPGKEILVVIYSSGDEETYKDNFMDFYYETRTVEYLTEIANRFFDNPEVTVSIPRASSTEGISPSTGFDEYIIYKNHLIHADITADTIDESAAVDFLKELKERGLHYSLSIIKLSTNDSYSGRYLEGYKDVYFERRTIE